MMTHTPLQVQADWADKTTLMSVIKVEKEAWLVMFSRLGHTLSASDYCTWLLVAAASLDPQNTSLSVGDNKEGSISAVIWSWLCCSATEIAHGSSCISNQSNHIPQSPVGSTSTHSHTNVWGKQRHMSTIPIHKQEILYSNLKQHCQRNLRRLGNKSTN